MKKAQILIIDDDRSVRKIVKKSLEYENMTVIEAASGSDARVLIQDHSYDLILLDIMLGDVNGLDLLRQIHEMDSNVPIILLSGKKEEHDKILGFGIGADDYITKPFSPAELCARIKAHIRRNNKLLNEKLTTNQLSCGPFTFYLQSYLLFKGDVEVFLSSKETKLMKFFMENPNQVFSKDQLYENIWNNTVVDDNSIMVYIRHLRTKIEEDPQKPKYLKTVWGIGYKFSPEEQSAIKPIT